MRLKIKAIAVLLTLCLSVMAYAAVPTIQWVPLLLNQLMIYLYPKNQEVLYPKTKGMQGLLASHHGFVCRTRILVTSPQTVAFYRERNKVENYLGTTLVGHWLENNRMCIDNQKIIAVTWDKNGKSHRYLSLKPQINLNSQMTLIYPRDFNATSSKRLIACKIRALNLSKRPLALYAGKISADTRIVLLKPLEQREMIANCFNKKAIIAVQVAQSSKKLFVSYYATPKRYSDINTVPMLEFPRQFSLSKSQEIDLKPDLLKLLLAAI